VLAIAIFITIVFLVQLIFGGDVTWWGTASLDLDRILDGLSNTSTWASSSSCRSSSSSTS
jgi:hypothetical protein